jgi:hypothetical protein
MQSLFQQVLFLTLRSVPEKHTRWLAPLVHLFNSLYSLVHQVCDRLLFLFELGKYVALFAASRARKRTARSLTCWARSASYFATACCNHVKHNTSVRKRLHWHTGTFSSPAKVSLSLSLLAGLRRCDFAFSHSSCSDRHCEVASKQRVKRALFHLRTTQLVQQPVRDRFFFGFRALRRTVTSAAWQGCRASDQKQTCICISDMTLNRFNSSSNRKLRCLSCNNSCSGIQCMGIGD